MKKWTDLIRGISLLTQFGLSLIIPLILCLGISWWLCNRAGFGSWVFIPGFVFGLGGSGMVAYNFYLTLERQDKKNEREKPEKRRVGYNRHL